MESHCGLLKQLERYKEELVRVDERLQNGADEHLQELQGKLARIVELLEGRVPNKKPRLHGVSVKEGDTVTALIDDRWQSGTVLEAKLPEYVVVNSAISGKTVRIEDQKSIKQPEPKPQTATTNTYSNPKAPPASEPPKERHKSNTFAVKKPTSSSKPKPKAKQDNDAIEERLSSWKAFSEKKRR